MAPAAARASRTAVDPQMAQNQLILFSFEFILIPVGGLLAPRRPPRAVTQGNQRAQGGGYPTARPPVPGRPSAAGVNCGGRVIMFPLWFDATPTQPQKPARSGPGACGAVVERVAMEVGPGTGSWSCPSSLQSGPLTRDWHGGAPGAEPARSKRRGCLCPHPRFTTRWGSRLCGALAPRPRLP